MDKDLLAGQQRVRILDAVPFPQAVHADAMRGRYPGKRFPRPDGVYDELTHARPCPWSRLESTPLEGSIPAGVEWGARRFRGFP